MKIHYAMVDFHGVPVWLYGIKEVWTSIQALNINTIAEVFVGSVRREALDYYLIINRHQINTILTEYITYYNSIRPHQGIKQNIPKKYTPPSKWEDIKRAYFIRLASPLLQEGSMTDTIFP